MALNVDHLLRTAATLEQALLALEKTPSREDILFDLYCANRNNIVHDYGEGFANDPLKLLPGYLADVRALAGKLQEVFDAAH